jgi:cytochrome c556
MRRSILLLALLACVGSAGAQQRKPDEAIAYRQGVFKLIRWNMGPLAAMAKGEASWDGAQFARRAARLSWLSYQVEEGFPKGSDTGAVTDAKPEIWANFDDFRAKLKDFQREAAALRDVAATGDEAASKAQLGKVGGTCKACHDEYKAD